MITQARTHGVVSLGLLLIAALVLVAAGIGAPQVAGRARFDGVVRVLRRDRRPHMRGF